MMISDLSILCFREFHSLHVFLKLMSREIEMSLGEVTGWRQHPQTHFRRSTPKIRYGSGTITRQAGRQFQRLKPPVKARDKIEAHVGVLAQLSTCPKHFSPTTRSNEWSSLLQRKMMRERSD